MLDAEFDTLQRILPLDVIWRLSRECRSLRIPRKKLERSLKRGKFLRLYDGTNLKPLARTLGISRSTAYYWLNQERRARRAGKAG